MAGRVLFAGRLHPMADVAALMTPLRPVNHPGHADQSSHGRKGRSAGVRDALTGHETAEQVSTAASTEAKRITGRDVEFALGGMDTQVAAEHAEGILRGLERYPNVPVQRVQFGGGDRMAEMADAWAETNRAGTVITFTRAGQRKGPEAYRRDLEQSKRDGYITDGTPTGAALHEFGHAVANSYALNGVGRNAARRFADKAGSGEWSDVAGSTVSKRAAEDHYELAGEAFADVMVHGAKASGLSKAVVAEFDAQVKASGDAMADVGARLAYGESVLAELAQIEARTYKRDKGGRFAPGGGKGKKKATEDGESESASESGGVAGVSSLPRMRKPPTISQAAKGTNPNYGTTGGMDQPLYRDAGRAGKNWDPSMGPPPHGAYEQNCTNVVHAFEMRARGYDVEAAPGSVLDKYGYSAGRTYAETDQQLAASWRNPDGTPHGRSFASQEWRPFSQIDAEAGAWPDGGRGFATVGKHVFNVVKTGGRVKYVEAQHDASPTRVVTAQYKKKYKGYKGFNGPVQEAKLVRLDDLEPADGIMDAVVAVKR